MAGFDRTVRAASAQLQASPTSAVRPPVYAREWNRAGTQRLNAAKSMYASLMREERQYQSLVSGAVLAMLRVVVASVLARLRRNFAGVGAASATHQLGRSVVAAERSISRGIASAFRERLKVSKAETGAEIFGELTREEVEKVRKAAIDRLGIKFGTGTEGALGVATELSKAGLGKEVLGDATELALKAKMALDVCAKTPQNYSAVSPRLSLSTRRDTLRLQTPSRSPTKIRRRAATEIIEGMKRGLSSIASTGGKLTPEQLAGLVGTAIDVGVQPGKSR